MPIQHAIWKVGTKPEPLSATRLPSEQTLKEMIVREPSILSSEWMLIGRQEVTSHGGRIDLLAIAPDGSLVLIELKRDRTPREIIAQALDYACWVEQLTADRIAQTYQRFPNGGNLDEAFRQRFGVDLDEETLKMLSPGDRVWVKIPKTGYVGVGRVTETVVPIGDFVLQTPGGERPALEVLKNAELYRHNADDPDKVECYVRVEWLDTVPEAKAINEVGLFGNQNTVCQPLTPKWRHTVERLKTYFPQWDQPTG